MNSIPDAVPLAPIQALGSLNPLRGANQPPALAVRPIAEAAIAVLELVIAPRRRVPGDDDRQA